MTTTENLETEPGATTSEKVHKSIEDQTLLAYAEEPRIVKKKVDVPADQIHKIDGPGDGKQFEDKEQIEKILGVKEETVYISDVTVFKLNDPDVKWRLEHTFSEPYEIEMMQI